MKLALRIRRGAAELHGAAHRAVRPGSPPRGYRVRAGGAGRAGAPPGDRWPGGAELGLFEELHGEPGADALAHRIRRGMAEEYGAAVRAFAARGTVSLGSDVPRKRGPYKKRSN